MAISRILGPDGEPVQSQTLREEIVTPTVTGVRPLFDELVAPGLTPARLSQLLRAAAQDDMDAYLTLAEEMEEREPHYRSVLGTRKTAIKSIEPFIRAPTEDAADEKLADAVKEELVDRPDFRDLIYDLLDAIGKGYSVAEIIWRFEASRWVIDRFEWRDPRLFSFDREERRHLRIRKLGSTDGMPLPPYKFAAHLPRLKSGTPARSGLARVAAWSFMLKSYTMKDWASFLEVHGMPLRLGKYNDGESAQNKQILLRAVRNLGSDAAAIIPRGMEIEFVEVKGFSDKPFEGMARYIDGQVSKAVIGQTMTADDGSSKSQAQTHDKVRTDIKEDDAVAIAVTLNRDVIRPWVDLNFGPRPHNRYPTLMLPVIEREDLAAYAKAIGELVDRGLEIEVAEVRDRVGHRAPKDGAALMRPGATVSERSEQIDDTPPGRKAKNHRFDASCCPGCGARSRLALNADDPTDERDALVDEALGDWEPVMEPVRARLEDEFKAATSYADLDRRLVALAAAMPTDELARAIAVLGLKARGLGGVRRDG